ncbi:mitogen-activated protein kinase-binding protein 1 isoform X3 [Eurytemora carolleeae]|uniref:mitogen-activated protein kinase-binding protein 1 isoform X3 n=1 Tax=Eurytemora carolleeae TaxID=1294199 RepID=UPI000C7575F5|nr:mitogen-activated protein kinase-binding protein 1 isoform X3 [Eurytemora carolleeae]|eukprot:XP_023335709.1 mitogen-activated protein kinase-binding protein 1-like isoform X3 [Eurytemora affinis]
MEGSTGGTVGPPGGGGAPVVRRLRTLKRRKEEKESSKNQVKLERVLGLTVSSNASLATAPSSGLVAYPAGCTVVLFNPRKNKQTHVGNPGRKTITAVGWSEDGRYLVTGECGHLPSVRVWDNQEKQFVGEFQGHKYGINCVAFAPNNKYIVSVGSQHDMIVNVWDWRNNIKVASNKVSTKVKAISFAENGSYFVTAGNRHVKFWYLEYSRSAKYKEPVPLMGRSAILGEQRNNYFCDVACGRGEMGDSTYAITKSGLLCEFNNRRLLDKWVELRTTSANCLSVGEELIFIGCADGIVRCFSPHSLQFVTTLPTTHYLGVDVSKGLTSSHMASHPQNALYPDASAVSYDEQNGRVSVVYNDHSLYIWDVKDVRKVGKSHSFLYHSACIWGLEMYPANIGDGKKAVLPAGSFITCGSDDTIRIWNMDSGLPTNTLYRRNIYSEELLKTMYIDPALGFIKEADNSLSSGEKDTVYDQRNGVRCIRISPNGKHLASGDRAGNIRVHELQFMDELCKIEAHDAEVLCLEYSLPSPGTTANYLASASRDRLTNLFNAGKNYSFLSTLDDHSSSITAVRFLPNQGQEGIQMVSCGADKSIIFRDVNTEDSQGISLNRVNHIVGKTTLYDMELDRSGKHILTACQDRSIRVYSVAGAKQTKSFKGSASEDGTLIKVVLDRSGIYCATSCTDKTLAIYDYHTGELMATMAGHSELVTGLAFSSDCKHLISVSGDSCIFVWRLPTDMVHTMQARLAAAPNRNSSRTYITSPPGAESPDIDNEQFGSPPPEFLDPNANLPNDNDMYRFSVGKLPGWAKTKIIQSSSPALQPQGDAVKGRWADRANQEINLRSFEDTPFNNPGEEDSSPKEGSSLEWARTGSSMSELESMSPHPSSQNPRPDTLDTLDSFNDADVDDYSTQDDGGESTEPENTGSTMYFGQVDEKSDIYHVNAMDVDELRKSQRRFRGSRADLVNSEDEEEEGGSSTPSADHSDKNIHSMHCISMESVDQVGRRERFLQSNFESLSGGDETMNSLTLNSSSISNAWREGGAMQRNAGTIEKARETRNAEQNRRREELQRRIEETRLKLQNDPASSTFKPSSSQIGYKSMKGSRSINDLSSFGDRETPVPSSSNKTLPRQRKVVCRPKSMLVTAAWNRTCMFTNRSQVSAEEDVRHVGEETAKGDEDGSGGTSLRRACSLSDLNKPNVSRRILPSPPNNVSGKKGSVSGSRPMSSSDVDRPDRQRLMERRKSVDDRRSSIKSPAGEKPLSRLEQHERMLAERERERREASRSAGLGHRQPSRTDLRPRSVAEDSDRDVPSYMRSTSASIKKEKLGNSPIDKIRRKSAANYSKSTNDLSGTTREEETSSEEEVRLRKRSLSQDRHGESSSRNGPIRAKSERDLSRVAKVKVSSREEGGGTSGASTPTKQRTKMKTTTIISNNGAMVVNAPPELPFLSARGSEAVDVTRAKLTRQLAERTNLKMQESADDLVKLYKRVSLDDDLDDQVRSELLSQLSAGASSTLRTLKLVCESPDSNGLAALTSFNSILARQATQQQQQQQQQDLANNPYFQHMLENYSSLMYQNMNQPNQPKPGPLRGKPRDPGGPSWC